MRVIHCLVIRSGFEPETHSLEGCCSIQLSYQTLVGMRLLFAMTTHEITHAGTQNSAYKGNLGRKGTAFLAVMQIISQKSAKLLQFSHKSSSNSFCKSGLRIAPT